jgi:hypothetical protein
MQAQTKTFVAVICDQKQFYTTLNEFSSVQLRLGEGDDVTYTEGAVIRIDGEGNATVIGQSNSFEDMKEVCEKCLTRFAMSVNLYPHKTFEELVRFHEESMQDFVKVEAQWFFDNSYATITE